VREVLPGPCPVCQAEIQYLYQTEEIPFFSEILIISTVCPSCGYRLADTQLLRNAEPSRWELRIEYPEDMMVRVIRSTNGAISIPELGVRIDPGPACEGFISNVEGVLVRVDGVLSNLRSWAESNEERERIDNLKESIARIQEGQLPATLVIEDLSGNSAIIADRATVCRIEALAEDPDEER
jgi:zinc finger protein